jgi:hypothetical protein
MPVETSKPLKFMQLILRTSLKFLPLFLGAICVVLLFTALVPGRLEYYLDIYTDIESNAYLWAIAVTLIPLLYIVVIVLAIYEIIQIFRHKQNSRQIPGILSVLVLIFVKSLFLLNIPARLYFYTHIQQIERVLARQSLDRHNKPFYFQTRNFIPSSSLDGIEDQYGFAYLPDRSKTYYETTHIHGKWYIFSGRNWIGSPMDVRRGE